MYKGKQSYTQLGVEECRTPDSSHIAHVLRDRARFLVRLEIFYTWPLLIFGVSSFPIYRTCSFSHKLQNVTDVLFLVLAKSKLSCASSLVRPARARVRIISYMRTQVCTTTGSGMGVHISALVGILLYTTLSATPILQGYRGFIAARYSICAWYGGYSHIATYQYQISICIDIHCYI